MSAHLATERALELFAPIQQADYVGWNGSGVGPKGREEALLAGFDVVDDPVGAKNAVPTAGDDGGVCLHTDVAAYDDDPAHGACLDCGEEFGLSGSCSTSVPLVAATPDQAITVSAPEVDDAACAA